MKPDYAIAYNNRGTVYRIISEYDLAIDDCNKAIELDPDYAEPYSNRGAAYREKGEKDHAIADYDRAIELKPDIDSFQNDYKSVAHFEGRNGVKLPADIAAMFFGSCKNEVQAR